MSHACVTLEEQMAYSTWAQHLLFDFLRENPGSFDCKIETTGAYKSPRELLTHMIGAERRWTLQRLLEQPEEPRYELTAPSDLEGVQRDFEDIRAKTISALDEDLDKKVLVKLAHWGIESETTKRAVYLQLLVHEALHRGQISMALQIGGYDPPNFDVPFMNAKPIAKS